MKTIIQITIILCLPVFSISQFITNLPGENNIYYDIAISGEGNSIVYGQYNVSEAYDFDPSPNSSFIPENSVEFLCSYDVSGNLNFAIGVEDISPLSIGNAAAFSIPSIGVDDQENIYVTGVMAGWFDFDPSSEVNDLKTNGLNIAKGYLVSYDSKGNFRYLIDLGLTGLSKIQFEIAPSGNSYLAFSLFGKSDVVSPSTGNNLGIENGYSYLLMSFDNQGECRFANSYLQKIGFKTNSAARIGIDKFENLHMCNLLFRDIDLDPDNEVFDFGVDTIQKDYFYIAKYNKVGDFIAADLVCEDFNRTVLGFSYAFEVAKNGNSYITSQTDGTVNFDLVNSNTITSILPDMFLASYYGDRTLRYVHSFGASSIVEYDGSVAVPLDIVAMNNGQIILTGNFLGQKDFDPSNEVVNLSSSDSHRRSFFLTFSEAGDLIHSFGFRGQTGSLPVSIVNIENLILVAGLFSQKTNFSFENSPLLLDISISNSFLYLLNTNPSDCYNNSYVELMKLYNSTNGQLWFNNGTKSIPNSKLSGWDKDCNYCQWYGVRCQDGEVTKIKLNGNNLTGIIPNKLNFYHLQEFNVRNNKISGSIQNHLFQTTCKSIDFSNNLFNGDISDMDLYYPDSEKLDLSDNNLYGCVNTNFFLCEAPIFLNGNPRLPFQGNFQAICNNSQIGAPCDDGNELNGEDIINENCDCIPIVTSLNEYKYETIKVFPNPFSEIINIEGITENFDSKKIRLVNSLGVLIDINIIKTTNQEYRIVTDKLLSGLYYLTIESEDGDFIYKKKLVKI